MAAEERFVAEVERITAASGGGLRVRRLDFVDGAQKAECFSQADLFLAASRWESFGLTVVEAMAAVGGARPPSPPQWFQPHRVRVITRSRAG